MLLGIFFFCYILLQILEASKNDVIVEGLIYFPPPPPSHGQESVIAQGLARVRDFPTEM